MSNNLILRVLVKMFVPFILLFGLYVQMHGDYGPGGGFQAGVVLAASFILFSLIFGVERAKKLIRPSWLEVAVPSGVIIFAGVGVITVFMGGNFLDYDVLDSHDPSHGQHLGILIVEFGVLVTVASTMLLIFYTFAGRGR
jgi:multicomponent Na+:H+ antiporter subunit B